MGGGFVEFSPGGHENHELDAAHFKLIVVLWDRPTGGQKGCDDCWRSVTDLLVDKRVFNVLKHTVVFV